MKAYRLFFITILSVIIGSCHRQSVPQSSGSMLNQEVTNARGDRYLLGKSTAARLQQAPYDAWYVPNYNAYTIDSTAARQLRPLVTGKQWLIFMATWCGDSRREVPRLFKLLDHLGVDPSQVQLVNVDNRDSVYKQSPGHEERGWKIHRVPTLVITENGKEKGRVVESPLQTWEKDLAAILEGAPYWPRYEAACWLLHFYETSNWKKKTTSAEAIARQLKSRVVYNNELNSLGTIQMATGETDKAIFTFRINKLIYPSDSLVVAKLAGAYRRLGDTASANALYRIDLRDPVNKP